MVRHAIAAALVVLCCLRTVEGAGTIADVSTLADLRKMPAVRTDSGYDVRIGMADPGNDAGPYRLIYCLAEPVGDPPANRSATHGEISMGPVGVSITSADREKAAVDVFESVQRDRGQCLFIQYVPIGTRDDVTVSVYDGDRLILERNLGKADQRPFYWSNFAGFKVGEWSGGPRPAWVIAEPWAGCPESPESTWLKLDSSAGATTRPAVPETAVLPGAVNLADEWRRFLYPDVNGDLLKLTLDGDTFAVKSPLKILPAVPADHFLARWWVNGKPVECPDVAAGDDHSEEMLPKMFSNVDRCSIHFGLPKMLGDLKAGDKVAVQLLLVERTQRLRRSTKQQFKTAVRISQPRVPLLTNRLEFTVDEHLLSLRSQ